MHLAAAAVTTTTKTTTTTTTTTTTKLIRPTVVKTEVFAVIILSAKKNPHVKITCYKVWNICCFSFVVGYKLRMTVNLIVGESYIFLNIQLYITIWCRISMREIKHVSSFRFALSVSKMQQISVVVLAPQKLVGFLSLEFILQFDISFVCLWQLRKLFYL